MKEIGVDISGGQPKKVNQFLDQPFGYVITVCDDAGKNCPYFRGKAGKRLHMGFPDPANATGSEAGVLAIFHNSRNDIKAAFRKLYEDELRPKLG